MNIPSLEKEQRKIQGFSDNRMIEQNKNSRKKIIDIQDEMLKQEQALDAFPVTHHFAPGVYAREIFLPKNHAVVGKIHLHAHLNILSRGHVIVATEDGTKELIGPCVFTSFAGTKRAVYIKEDTTWVTIHVTTKTDLDEIEKEIIANDFDDLKLEGDS